jgi:ligand-binding sensor domain-containing protein
MKKLILIFYLSSLIFHLVLAQAPKDNFVHFTEEDGLSGNTVYAVLQDRFGYIWLGTNSGLVRFDGYNFKNYYQDVEDPKSIQVAIIYSLYEDRKGDLWIGGVQGFSKYNRETDSFTSYSISSFNPDYSQFDNAYISVTTFTEDNKDHLLLGIGPITGGNNRNGLLYLDKTTQQVNKYPLADNDSTNSVITSFISAKGDYWFGGHSGLLHLDNQSHRIEFHRPDALNGEFDFNVAAIAEDNNGKLWIGTSGQGLYHFNPADGSFKKATVSVNFISAIYIDAENKLWLASGSGLVFYDPQNGYRFVYTPDKNNPLSINSSSLNCIIQDFAGSLWIGSNDGLNRFDKVGSHFTTFVHDPNDNSSFGPGWATYFAEDQNNDILIGLGEGSRFVNLFDRKRNIFQRIPFADSIWVSGMFKDKQGKVWAGLWGDEYLYQLRKDSKGFIKATGSPTKNRAPITGFYESGNDSLWFVTINGFSLYDKSRNTIKPFFLDTLNNPVANFITQITGDKDGNLWLAGNGGLFKFNPQTEQSSRIGFSNDSSKAFLDQDINSLYIDNKGIVWSGSWQGGLNRYNPQSGVLKIYTRKDGLPSNSVQGILGDEESNTLWLSTFKGLSRFDI